MGQQQLLLIVLGIIVIGISIAVGITMMKSSKSEQNRQALINDLLNLGRKAQQYYRTPAQMGGGSQDFKGFGLSAIDTANANGSFSVTSGAAPTGTAFVPGSITPIPSTASTVYIIGCGKENGDNGTTPVKCYVEVYLENLQIAVLN